MILSSIALAFCLLAPQDSTAAAAEPESFPPVPHGRPGGAPNHLTPLEEMSGWRLLFDGASTDGWVGFESEGVPQGWIVDDGCLHRAVAAKDILTTETFGDFELTFEWKVAKAVNSGVKYRLEGESPRYGNVGCEYQVLDDANREDNPKCRAGALYAIAETRGATLAPAGEFNWSRIVARGDHVEHWLNGVRVLQLEVGSDPWLAAKAKSKFRDVETFGTPKRSPILLQDHGGKVWFRNLKIREFDAIPGERVELFDGESLAGWRALGDAIFEPDEGCILGRIGGGGQSFLVTERPYGDFILEVELKNEMPGNSGIQVRSHQRENGRLFGYQIEIDASERAWSAGLYDEARRGWLQNLEDNEAGRRAFRNGDWNTYRIECLGPWIRVWLNGVPTVDYFDTADLEGVIGLQVHSGNNTRMRWRDFRMIDLGESGWEAIDVEARPETTEPGSGSWRFDGDRLVFVEALPASDRRAEPLGDFALRFRYRSSDGQVGIGHGMHWAGGSDPSLDGDGGANWCTLMMGAGPDKQEFDEVTVCSFGGRIAVHLNGKNWSQFPGRGVGTAWGQFRLCTPKDTTGLVIESAEIWTK